MDMGMKAEVLSPSVQNGGVSNRCTQILFVFGQLLQCLCNTSKQQMVAVPLIAVDQQIQFLGNSKNHMEISNVQEIGLLSVNPSLFGNRLAFWTMPVPAGVVGRFFISATWAVVHMTAELGSSATLDRIHGVILSKRQLMAFTVGCTMLCENILYLRHLHLPLACAHAFSAVYQVDW